MRPVDRAKRQEVWLYLSSFDFTAWSRVDLMSPDFQHYIERLFIQFVQRNRSFLVNRDRRMSDIRMLISSCASTVAQGLRDILRAESRESAICSPRRLFPGPRQLLAEDLSLVGNKSPLHNALTTTIAGNAWRDQASHGRGWARLKHGTSRRHRDLSRWQSYYQCRIRCATTGKYTLCDSSGVPRVQLVLKGCL